MKSDTLTKFNWKEITAYCSYDCDKCIKVLANVILKKTKQFDKDPDCWLSKPIDFLMSGATNNQKCVYLHLATKRNMLENESTIPNYIVSNFYGLELLKTNPLLYVGDKRTELRY